MPYSHCVHASARRMPSLQRQIGSNPKINDVELAACKDTSLQNRTHAVVRVSTRSIPVQRDQWDTYWGPKKVVSCFAVLRPTTPQAGRAGLILSIPVKQVSLGSPRVGTIHAQAPTPHAPALQAFLADFSQQPAEE